MKAKLCLIVAAILAALALPVNAGLRANGIKGANPEGLRGNGIKDAQAPKTGGLLRSTAFDGSESIHGVGKAPVQRNAR